jgi:hypothetical protein
MTRSLTLALLSVFLWLPTWAEEASVIEGRIQDAGPSIYMEGSHELVDSQGVLVARLSGMKHDVDLNAYKGEWVQLTGEWRPTVEAGGKIFEVRTAAQPSCVR